MSRPLFFLITLLLISPATARDASTLRERFLAMQAAHAEEMNRFSSERDGHETQEVNRLIIALVRTEQAYRDEGDLTGVLQTRRLQESLLNTPRLPGLHEEFSAKIQEQLQAAHQNLRQSHQEIQQRIDARRLDYARQLEPVMRDLTRAGDFETARDLLEIRSHIFAALNIRQEPRPTHRTIEQLRAPNDPNVFPLLLEPEALRTHPILGTRRPQLVFHPRLEGQVEILPRAFQLNGGRITLPAHVSEALIYQIRQTHSFTLEISFRASERFQQATLLSMGSEPGQSNLALLHEGGNLILLLKTTGQGGEPARHRVDLGAVNEGRYQQLILTYRPGDLAVYRNGSNTRRNRADATGDLRGWDMQPVHLGHHDFTNPMMPPTAWSGVVLGFSMTATPASARQVTTAFERFVSFISNR